MLRGDLLQHNLTKGSLPNPRAAPSCDHTSRLSPRTSFTSRPLSNLWFNSGLPPPGRFNPSLICI